MHGDRSIVHDPDSFCLDGSGSERVEYPSSLGLPQYVDIVHYSGLEVDQTAVICLLEENDEDQPEVS